MKKKIIILALLLIIPLLFNNNCKGSSFSFDVNGSWEITITYDCGAEYVIDITFSGSSSSGDIYIGGLLLGSYTVSDKDISFSYQTMENTVTYYYDYSGEAKSEDEMEGDIEQFFEQVMLNSSNLSSPQIKVSLASGNWKGKKKKK